MTEGKEQPNNHEEIPENIDKQIAELRQELQAMPGDQEITQELEHLEALKTPKSRETREEEQKTIVDTVQRPEPPPEKIYEPDVEVETQQTPEVQPLPNVQEMPEKQPLPETNPSEEPPRETESQKEDYSRLDEPREPKAPEMKEETSKEKEVLKAVSEEIKETKQRWIDWLREKERRLMPADARERVERALSSVDVSKITETLKSKKIFGSKLLIFFSTAGAGAGARFAVRAGLGSITGGSGYLLAAGASGISGAIIEGTKTWVTERKRVQEALKNYSESETERKSLEALKEKIGGGELRERLHKYLLEVAPEEDKRFLPETNRELYESLRKEFWTVRKGQIFRGMLTGAAIGALGSTVGYGLMHLAEGLFGAKEAVEEVLKSSAEESGKEGAAGVSAEVLKEKMAEASTDAYAKTYNAAVQKGSNNLLDNHFTAVAEKGEGVTHLTRKLIHDFIVENQQLGRDLTLERGELIYAEDFLKDKLDLEAKGISLQVGNTIELEGSVINEAVEKAQELTDAEIKNLNKEWVPKISEDTWNKLAYGDSFSSANDFSDGIIEGAKEKAQQAAESAVAEVARQLAVHDISGVPETGRTPEKDINNEKDEWFGRLWEKYKFHAAGVGVIAAELALLNFWVRNRSRRAGKEIGLYGMAKDIIRTRKNKVSVRSGKKEIDVTKILTEFRPSRKHSSFILTALRKAREMVQRPTAEKKGNKKEQKAKFEADPMVHFLRARGVDVRPKNIGYYISRPKNIKEYLSGESSEFVHKNFNNYSDAREFFLNKLSPHERDMGRIRFDRGFLVESALTKLFKTRPEEKSAFEDLINTIAHGGLGDTYRSEPPREKPHHGAVAELIYQLGNDFGINFGDASGIGVEGRLKVLNEIRAVLPELPEETRDGVLPYVVIDFGITNRVYRDEEYNNIHIIIDVLPQRSPHAWKEYFKEAAEKVEELRKE